MLWIGVDIGSSGCKAAAFDETGTQHAGAYRPYPLRSPWPGWRELDAEVVWARVQECLTEVCAGGLGQRVTAIAVSAQGEAIIPMDRDGLPLAPAQVSFDTRSASFCDLVYSQSDRARLQGITGTPRHSMFSLYKLLWLQQNEPAVLTEAWRIGTFADWIAYRMGGELVMDYSLASRTAFFDATNERWSDWIVDSCGVPGALLPAVAPSGTAVGVVRETLADQLGLARGVVIGTGGHDQVCGALGAGVTAPGQAMNSMGTTDSVVSLTTSFESAGRLAALGLACGSGAVPDTYAMHAFVLSTGSLAAWFRDTWETKGMSLGELTDRATTLPDSPGVLVLPHFSGSGTPYLDERSKGAIIGLTLETTPVDVYRAVLEGVCFELSENIDHMTAAGAVIDTVKVIGGASRSDSYLQLKADILGRLLTRPRVTEAGCLGAALLGAYAAGDIGSLSDAASIAAPVARSFEPDMSRHARLSDLARLHSQLYPMLRELQA